MRGEVLTVMNAADTEKFTATADLLDGLKSALHTLPLRAKYEPRRLEAVELKKNICEKQKTLNGRCNTAAATQI